MFAHPCQQIVFAIFEPFSVKLSVTVVMQALLVLQPQLLVLQPLTPRDTLSPRQPGWEHSI